MMHPSEVDSLQCRFLTKTGELQLCTPEEAAIVLQNNGVLYHPEVPNTTLKLVFKDKLEVLKDIARNHNDFTVEIKFSELSYMRPFSWGFYRRDSYIKADSDCAKLKVDAGLDAKNPQPLYFMTAIGKEEEAKIPEIVMATLDSLRVLNKDGKVIGGYRVAP